MILMALKVAFYEVTKFVLFPCNEIVQIAMIKFMETPPITVLYKYY
jgi:hypothetical protein